MTIYLTINGSDTGDELYISHLDIYRTEDYEEWLKEALLVFKNKDEVKVSIQRNILNNILKSGGVIDVQYR